MQAYYGIENEDVWRSATGLGAGLSRRGFACGALTGGIVAIGLVGGRQRNSDKDDRFALRDETYAKSQQLIRRFEERFGTIDCLAMTECDFLTPEGRQKYKDTSKLENTCKPAVRLVVETVPELCG